MKTPKLEPKKEPADSAEQGQRILASLIARAYLCKIRPKSQPEFHLGDESMDESAHKE